MDGLGIRPACLEDIAALQALDSYALEDASRTAAIADWVAAGDCFCAEVAGNPAGYGVMHDRFFGQPMLEMVMVGRAWRRLGIGSRMIEYAIHSAPGPVLWTSTNQSNLPMQALLAKLGFRRSGLIEGLDEGDRELIYRILRA